MGWIEPRHPEFKGRILPYTERGRQHLLLGPKCEGYPLLRTSEHPDGRGHPAVHMVWPGQCAVCGGGDDIGEMFCPVCDYCCGC